MSNKKAAERIIEVNGVTVHVRSVFNGQTDINDALAKIISRKLAEAKK